MSFVQHLTYHRASWSPENIRADLQLIRAYDERAELGLRMLRWSIVAGWLLLVFGSCPIAMVLQEAGVARGGTILVLPVIFAFSVLLAGLYYVARRQRRQDLEDRRYELLLRLLDQLEVDLYPGTGLDVWLALDPWDAKHKRLYTASLYAYYHLHAHERWLQLTGRLADGTRFRLYVDQLRRVRDHKRKSKRKELTRSHVTLDLRPKQSRYPDLDLLVAPARASVQLPAGAVLRRLDARRDRLVLGVKIKEKRLNDTLVAGFREVDLHECVTAMLLSAYQVLNHARARAERG